MEFPISQLPRDRFPSPLGEIPEPPTKLWLRGNLPPTNHACLAVVGSRKYTTYAKQCVEYLIEGLRGYDVAIISGLALGVDGLAHEAALRANLFTLAIPGSGLDESVLYPARHKVLARKILNAGGGLLSEYEPMFGATKWSFPKRNRIMAGLSQAVLVVEAGERSGTLITARLATEYNRDVLTIPGSIFSDHSAGPHMLLRLGATPVTSPGDILEALHIESEAAVFGPSLQTNSPQEILILEALTEERDKDELARITNIPTHELSTLLSMMELDGLLSVDMNIVRKKR